MNRHEETPAAAFAREILRRHPQIRYEHAVSAAEFAGLDHLPPEVFFDAIEALGLPRDRVAEQAALATASPVAGSGDDSSRLLARLELLRGQVRETAAMRAALERMREAVRAALDQA